VETNKQNKTKQTNKQTNKTKQNKTKQNKTKQTQVTIMITPAMSASMEEFSSINVCVHL